ncbi:MULTISPECIES: hypothetical protein [Mitsuokella]|nr:hypothetical protein [Mitsuokella multacida]
MRKFLVGLDGATACAEDVQQVEWRLEVHGGPEVFDARINKVPVWLGG